MYLPGCCVTNRVANSTSLLYVLNPIGGNSPTPLSSAITTPVVNNTSVEYIRILDSCTVYSSEHTQWTRGVFLVRCCASDNYMFSILNTRNYNSVYSGVIGTTTTTSSWLHDFNSPRPICLQFVLSSTMTLVCCSVVESYGPGSMCPAAVVPCCQCTIHLCAYSRAHVCVYLFNIIIESDSY